jgi:hypothetical protein
VDLVAQKNPSSRGATVLLVDDHQLQFPEGDVVLEQGMGADRDGRLA